MKMNRMTTGLIVLTFGLTVLCVQGILMRLVFMALTCVGMWEMYNALSAKGMRPARWAGMAYAALAMPIYLATGSNMLMPLTSMCCVLGLAAVLFRGEIDFDAAVATLFPIFYPGLLFTMFYPLQDLGNPMLSTLALCMAFLIPAACDTAAYYVGRYFGKHKMAPKLSPKKTVEGGAGGLLGAMLFALVLALIFKGMCLWFAPYKAYADTMPALWKFLPIGLISGAFSTLGDLAASMVKRYCGIKDYGTLLPGHGGVLDRMDSTLFNAVVIYTFFLIVM